jgi:methionyl aminopeptidase
MRSRKNNDRSNLKSSEDISRIREAGMIIAEIFKYLGNVNFDGMSTGELDSLIDKEIRSRKGRASFATVPGYKYASCLSVNDGVVHGIPDNKFLMHEGDIVKVDVGVVKNGYFADACRTYMVGKVSEDARRLVEATRRCLDIGVSTAMAGNRIGDIGAAIQLYAEGCGYSVVRDYCGHGVGFAVHEEPSIPHYGREHSGLLIRPGMVLAIEPMINAGRAETKLLPDGWTAVTRDGSLSAQFENTIAVTDNGVEVLTE